MGAATKVEGIDLAAGAVVAAEKRRFDGGFTLIEVLIAVTLTAIFLTAIYYTFFSMLESRETITSALERQREVRRFLDIASMELGSAYVSKENPKSLFRGRKAKVGSKAFSTLDFTFFTHTVVSEGRKASDLKAVKYFVEEVEDDRFDLLKDKRDAYADPQGEASFKVSVVEDITGFEVSYFNGSSWVGGWSSGTASGAPEAVKLKVSVSAGGGTEHYSAISRPMIKRETPKNAAAPRGRRKR